MHGLIRRPTRILVCIFVVAALCAPDSFASTVSKLFARGYDVIPLPQQVELKGGDFEFGGGWRLDLGSGVKADGVAVESLKEGLSSRDGIALEVGKRGRGKTIELTIRPGSVRIGEATDRNRSALEEQAYRLDLGANGIRITANATAGLFYGVETLVQLVKARQNKLWLPEAEITDWPDLELRNIYWDDNHHLEHVDVLKAALRQAAFYKVNGFVIKLNGHFQYKSAPALVEPYALSPEQLQELTDYGLRYHVQLIPYVDGPAHDAWILKHPEYAKLGAFPDSNYEFCTTNPGTYKLLFGMYQDLMDANKGVKYFHFGGDEPYFVGRAHNSQCDEATLAKKFGTVGRVLAEFDTKGAKYIHGHGRTPTFAGYQPLVPSDIASLPSYLVNVLTAGPKYDAEFKARGIRQMTLASFGGYKERFFPNYYVRPSTESLPGPAGGSYEPTPPGPGRVAEIFNHISFAGAAGGNLFSSTSERKYADLMGTFVAGWGDSGLHPETMWLGYVAGADASWHPGGGNPRELMTAFYRLFYGPGSSNMGRLYQLMSEQAQFWKDSWKVVASSSRPGLWGDFGPVIFKPRRPARGQTFPLPPVPTGDLLVRDDGWQTENAKRLQLASVFYSQNDELMDLLHEKLQSVRFNHYNLEVYLSIVGLYRQNLEMILELSQMDSLLDYAQQAAADGKPKRAVGSLDRALDLAKEIREQRNVALDDTVATWYKSWDPRVAEANGRRYLNVESDVKDHTPEHTVDMSYLIYRELVLPLGNWYDQVEAARNQYAKVYGLPARSDELHWKETQAGSDTR
jgi:hexosaminidase